MTTGRLIINALKKGILDNGSVRIAFPGGRSAVSLMEELSHSELDWSAVHVTLVDERAVDHSHEASNARLVRSTLCINHAYSALFEPLFVGKDAETSAQLLNQAELLIDIAVLGMGEDGHFASLFPNKSPVQGLADLTDGFVATGPIGSPSVPRISMTLQRILSAPLVVLLVSSDAKQEKVMAGLKAVDPLNPVSYLLASDHLLSVVWPDQSVTTLRKGVVQ
ncbi:MAG: 6-phosphogluconolactonase [Pseudomonadota bacterium]|nr:6-phosphogluconolactonase [Pseudomonadota bacterium]